MSFGIFGLVSLVIFNPFGSQVFFNHTIPYNYGSMIKEYLSELVKIAPFSVDTRSGGRPNVFHPATVASSVRIANGLIVGLIGMLLFLKNSAKLSKMMASLKLLLNGPTYDTKADARRTSPIMTLRYSPKSIIDCYHLSSSLPRAPTSL